MKKYMKTLGHLQIALVIVLVHVQFSVTWDRLIWDVKPFIVVLSARGSFGLFIFLFPLGLHLLQWIQRFANG